MKKLCIHRDVLPEFTEILLAGVVAHRCDDPSLTDTQMGPVIDRTAG